MSDIHVDLRPTFASHLLPDGRSWADTVHTWALSFELGVAKPDPAIFRAALDGLEMPASHLLMVGDRGGWDGAAVEGRHDDAAAPPARGLRGRAPPPGYWTSCCLASPAAARDPRERCRPTSIAPIVGRRSWVASVQATLVTR